MIGLDIKTRDGTEEERSNALDAMPTTWLEAFGTTFSLASENLSQIGIVLSFIRSLQ